MPHESLTNFLHQKFPRLNREEPVAHAAQWAEVQTGKALPEHQHLERIANFIKLFSDFRDKIHAETNPTVKQELTDGFKQFMLDPLVTKYKDIPDSYWKSYEGNLRARGQAGDWSNLPEDKREKMRRADTAPLLEDQQASIEEWFDYFISEDSADIPDELKYWVFRSLTQLQAFEKTEDNPHIAFTRRSKGSLKKYPDLNYKALRYVVEKLQQKLKGEPIQFEHDIEGIERTRFTQYLQTEKFADLYAWAMELMNPIPEHLLPITAGAWRRYPKGSNSEVLASTLRGKGTGLCIAGKGAAKRYIQDGDLYVYFSNDEQGNPIFPRAAIHVTINKAGKQHVAEVRGIAHKQNLDPYIAQEVSAKLSEFPDGHLYQKKAEDMQQVTMIEQKTKTGVTLSRDELIFLYEVDTKIQGFGYQPDPRIPELRKSRDQQADMLVIFECTADQIAHSQAEVTADTKAYVGPLYPNIFQELYRLENIYTQFPERKIHRSTVEIGGKTKDELQAKLNGNNIQTENWTKELMAKMTTSTERTIVEIVKLSIADLGFPQGCTTTQLFVRATELGLEFCPAEVGPYYRLQYLDQPDRERLSIGMEPITDSHGDPGVFNLDCSGGKPGLGTHYTDRGITWSAAIKVVFSLSKGNLAA